MVSWLFCFLCFTSSVSLTSFYTEDEPHFGKGASAGCMLQTGFCVENMTKQRTGIINSSVCGILVDLASLCFSPFLLS